MYELKRIEICINIRFYSYLFMSNNQVYRTIIIYKKYWKETEHDFLKCAKEHHGYFNNGILITKLTTVISIALSLCENIK